jgi:outer membrane murein-binding lipoprotein Lpp
MNEKLNKLIEKITAHFSKVEAIDNKFLEASLEDGSILKIEGDLMEDSAVFVVTKDGEIPAPDGVHKIQVGEKSYEITVEGGLIKSISENAPADNTQMKNEFNAEVKYNEVSTSVESLKASIDTLTKELSALRNSNSELAKASKETFNAVQLIIDAPSAKPTVKNDKSIARGTEDKYEKFRALAEALRNNK